MAISDLNVFERIIITNLLSKAAQNGWAVSVNDGEEWTVKASTDAEAIAEAIGTTEETNLMFRKVVADADVKAWPKLGIMQLIHGNAEDVISDHTDNVDMEALATYATSTEAMDAAAVTFMATHPELTAMSLNEWLDQHHDALKSLEIRTGRAILKLHEESIEWTNSRVKLTQNWGFGGQTV